MSINSDTNDTNSKRSQPNWTLTTGQPLNLLRGVIGSFACILLIVNRKLLPPPAPVR